MGVKRVCILQWKDEVLRLRKRGWTSCTIAKRLRISITHVERIIADFAPDSREGNAWTDRIIRSTKEQEALLSALLAGERFEDEPRAIIQAKATVESIMSRHSDHRNIKTSPLRSIKWSPAQA